MISVQSCSLVWIFKLKSKSWTDSKSKGFIPVTNHFPVDIVIKHFLRKLLPKGTKEPILEKSLFLVDTVKKVFPEKILWLIIHKGILGKNLSVTIAEKNFYSSSLWKNMKKMFVRRNHKQPRISLQNLWNRGEVNVTRSQKKISLFSILQKSNSIIFAISPIGSRNLVVQVECPCPDRFHGKFVNKINMHVKVHYYTIFSLKFENNSFFLFSGAKSKILLKDQL